MIQFFNSIFNAILGYLIADWYILLFGILIAVSMDVYGNPEKFKAYLTKHSGASIPAAVAFGAFTPLCACGTMGVLLAMFVTSLPWGAVMAFLVSSPLTSPSEFLFEGAFLGWSFAKAMLVSSLILGFSAGFVATFLEKHTSFFNDQFRLLGTKSTGSSPVTPTTLLTSLPTRSFVERYRLKQFALRFYELGIKKILFYFILFIALGRVVEYFIPTAFISQLFGANSAASIPLAATIGLPLYLNNASAMPLLRTFMDAGASQGAILAFLIAGKATGIPVITGMSAFIRRRAMIFYVLWVYVGAMICGTLYQFFI